MKPFLISITALMLVLPVLVHAEVVSRIAAVVNDEIITTYQLDEKLKKTPVGEKGLENLSADELSGQRVQVLRGLIEDALIQQRVKQLGLRVNDEELEAAISDVLKQNNITRPQLAAALQAQGMSFEVYQENLSQQILRFKLMGKEVRSKVEVSHQEVLDYFRDNIDQFRTKPAAHIGRLTFEVPEDPTPLQVKTVRNRALEVLGRLKQGADFFATVEGLSGDPKVDGGDMGTFAEGELTPAFNLALRGLNQGEVSELIETPQGLHILKVLGRSQGSIKNFDEVKGEITKILSDQKTAAEFKTWAEGLSKDAYIDIRL